MDDNPRDRNIADSCRLPPTTRATPNGRKCVPKPPWPASPVAGSDRSEPPGSSSRNANVQRQHRVQLDGIQKDLAATKTARDNEAKRANGLHHLQQNVLNMLLERLARVTVLRSVLSEVFDKAGYRLEFDTAEG